jgi:hypothetical protein
VIIDHFRKWLKLALATFIVLFVLAELAYWQGSLGASAGAGFGNCAVLVAGYPANTDGSLHPMQRMRVEVGVNAYRNQACDRLIVSGAAAHNEHVEAKVMAVFARELGIPDDHLIIEDRALNTWQNISCSLPYLENYGRIFIASDNLHIHRAKRYLCRQKPSWCDRVQITGRYLPLSIIGWTVPFAFHELLNWIRDLALYERSDANNIPSCPAPR